MSFPDLKCQLSCIHWWGRAKYDLKYINQFPSFLLFCYYCLENSSFAILVLFAFDQGRLGANTRIDGILAQLVCTVEHRLSEHRLSEKSFIRIWKVRTKISKHVFSWTIDLIVYPNDQLSEQKACPRAVRIIDALLYFVWQQPAVMTLSAWRARAHFTAVLP